MLATGYWQSKYSGPCYWLMDYWPHWYFLGEVIDPTIDGLTTEHSILSLTSDRSPCSASASRLISSVTGDRDIASTTTDRRIEGK